MAINVNVAQYKSVPKIIDMPIVGQFPGPLIAAANVNVDGSAAVAWNEDARYAMVTIVSDFGIVYANSAATASPALAVGAGQAITEVAPIIRRDNQGFLLLREHA